MAYTWTSPSTIQLSTTAYDLQLFSFLSKNRTVTDRDLLQLPAVAGQLQLFDQDRQYVTTIDASVAETWQIIDYLTQDTTDIQDVSIPLYLPVSAQSIRSFLMKPQINPTNLTEFELSLDYLRIVNYVQDLTAMEQYGQQLADYLQRPDVRNYLADSSHKSAVEDWINYFDHYPLELSQLIVAEMKLNWADIFFDDVSSTSLFNLDHLRSQFSTTHLLQIAADLRIDNKNINPNFQGLNDNPNFTLAVLDKMRIVDVNLLIRFNNYLNKDVRTITNYWSTRVDQLNNYPDMLKYIDAEFLLANVHNIKLYYEEFWRKLTDNPTLTGELIETHIVTINNLPHYQHPYSFVWNSINLYANLSKQFLINKWQDPQYHWTNNIFRNHQLDLPWLIEFTAVPGTPHPVFKNYDMQNPYWTWPQMKKLIQANIIDKPAQYVYQVFWVQCDDIPDMIHFLQPSPSELNGIWKLFISSNPNLTASFVLQHINQMSLYYVVRQPYFTPDILIQILALGIHLDGQTNSVRELLINPNFGLSFWLYQAEQLLPITYHQLLQEANKNIAAGAIQNIFEYFQYFLKK